jgi:hypothetical protein
LCWQPIAVIRINIATRIIIKRRGRRTNAVRLCMTIFHLLDIEAGRS